MGAGPVRGELVDAGVAARIPDTNAALAGLVVVLGREQQRAVGGKGAVTIEVAARRAGERCFQRARPAVDHKREGARATRERDSLGAGRMGGSRMAPVGQGQAERGFAGAGQADQGVGAFGRFRGSKKSRAASVRPACPRGDRGRGEARKHGASGGHGLVSVEGIEAGGDAQKGRQVTANDIADRVDFALQRL